MPEYRYKAVDRAGGLQEGVFWAEDRALAEQSLRERGLLPLEIKKPKWAATELGLLLAPKIRTDALAVFCRQMSMILKAGITVPKGLELTGAKVKDKTLGSEITRMFREVQTGRSLSETMLAEDSRMPKLLARMVATGEASGNLERVLEEMGIYYQRMYEAEKKIKGAMFYPAMLVLVALGLIFFVFTFLIPQIESLLVSSGAKLPPVTRSVLAFSHGFKGYLTGILIVLLLFLAGMRAFLSTDRGRFFWDSLLAQLPVLGPIIRNFVTVRFASTAAIVFGSGMPLMAGLELIGQNLQNEVAVRALKEAEEGVRRGEAISYHLENSGFFDPLAVQMVRVGEQTGHMDQVMRQLADFYEREAELSLTQMLTLVEPVMILVIGVIIGSIVVAVMFPLFNLVSTINMPR